MIQTQPTIGSNVEEITHKNLKLQAWDLGGINFIFKRAGKYSSDLVFLLHGDRRGDLCYRQYGQENGITVKS